MRIAVAAFAAFLVINPVLVAAQDTQTLADIRQELTVLNVEIQRLKRELSTTGAPSTNLSGTTVLDRVSAIEVELRRLTAQTEQLEFRVNRVIDDGTNRIGDLEFRLVELEGGDVSTLGETSTLGGDTGNIVAPAVAPESNSGGQTNGGELAVGEKADFLTASDALDGGDPTNAAEMFRKFNENYPGSPLAAEAEFKRGRALSEIGDTREAARAYLASFTSNADGPVAPDALFELGAALGQLGQVSQACITLAEVATRYPVAPAVARAREEMAALGCT